MFGKTRKFVKELMSLKKEGGMKLCDECAERKARERTDDEGALNALVVSGKFKIISEGKCFLCDEDAHYFIGLDDAMRGVQAVSKSKL